MINDVTDVAADQLMLLANSFGIPQNQVVFKVEAKMRMPVRMLWYIEPAIAYDSRFIPTEVNGIRFAVERNGAIFLAGATLDYDEDLLADERLYCPVAAGDGKPVWPRGFVFENQQYHNTLT